MGKKKFPMKWDFSVQRRMFLITGEIWWHQGFCRDEATACAWVPELSRADREYQTLVFSKIFQRQTHLSEKKKKKYFLLGKCLQNDSQTANEQFTSRLPVKTGVLCSSLQLWAVQLSGRIRYTRHPKGKPSNMTESNLTTIMVMSVFIEGLTKGRGAPPAQDQWRDLTFFLW